MKKMRPSYSLEKRLGELEEDKLQFRIRVVLGVGKEGTQKPLEVTNQEIARQSQDRVFVIMETKNP